MGGEWVLWEGEKEEGEGEEKEGKKKEIRRKAAKEFVRN